MLYDVRNNLFRINLRNGVMCYGAGLLKAQELPHARKLNYDHLMTLLHFAFPHMDYFL